MTISGHPALGLPTPANYASRLATLQRLMRTAGLDYLLLGDPDNHLLLAGIAGIPMGRPVWIVVPADGECTIVTPRIEATEIRAMTWIPNIHEWIEWTDEAGTPRDWLRELTRLVDPHSTIGIEWRTTSAAVLHSLGEALPDAELVDAGPTIRAWRIHKDAAALAVLRLAGDVTAAQLQAATAAAVPGAREIDISLAARAAGITRSTELLGEIGSPLGTSTEWFGVVAAGDRSAIAHTRGSSRRLEDGDLVQICLCGRAFFSHVIGFDRPITVGQGPLNPALARICQAAREAQAAALQATRPGAPACDVHNAAAAVLADHGLADSLLHRTGRGVGVGDEWPELREDDTTVLEPGMVVTVEPGCYVPGIGGARYGDTVVITPDGYEALTAIDLGR